MSACFVAAFSDYAFACADTHINARFIDGRTSLASDIENLEVDLGRGVKSFGPTGRKLRLVPFGAVVAAGCVPLISGVFDAYIEKPPDSLSNAVTTLVSACQQELPSVMTWWKEGESSVLQTKFLFVHWINGRFDVQPVGVHGRLDHPPSTNYYLYLLTPPEFSGEERSTLSHLEAKLGARGQSSIGFATRCFAEMFHEIHQKSRTVSDRLDLAVLRRKINRIQVGRLTEGNPKLLRCSDSRIEQLLSWVDLGSG